MEWEPLYQHLTEEFFIDTRNNSLFRKESLFQLKQENYAL